MDGEDTQAKALQPLLQRAEEVAKFDPKVAYYCRMQAVVQGMAMKPLDKITSALLSATLKQLEVDKAKANLDSVEVDQHHCEEFAVKVFRKADNQDRAGRANVDTAKTYYAASIFMEMLHQFGPIKPEIANMQRYAVWKAADIRKALKDGRTPTAGPPGTNAEEDAELEAELEELASEKVHPASTGAHLTPEGGRWMPEWGKPCTYKPGEMVLCQQPDGGSALGAIVELLSQTPYHTYKVEVDGSLMTVNLGQLAPPPRPRNCPSDQQNHFSNDIPAPLSDPSINDKLPNAPSQPAITHPLSAPSVPPSYGSSPTLATQGNSHFLPTPSQMYEPLAPAQDKNSKAPWDPTKGGAPPAAMYPSIGAVNDCVGPAVHHGTTNTAPGYAGMAYQTVAPGFKPGVQAVGEAQKNAKYAASSLQFDDVDAAIKYLQTALLLLTAPKR
mmetsp:Transcript_45029/g.86078  ORF Transcript_45029/g.86078 Transcript_45029/m.86078 type:complete len:442 (-) Transcript_45029:786-2111(-)|eukprot:CAMPEP_0114245522 /NCGR_PEP_ID=MMETSP0058-20121206/11947_1 /TAXON_ID=36894 /ORGANISM="Pyramimonas parkeae, CCMP726" /LENGTH=441 /DNA_ID=CAMNT_0001358593 /DNA_START=106 /DNA_END=1431 /DNA_ORIENTATION=+